MATQEEIEQLIKESQRCRKIADICAITSIALLILSLILRLTS